MPPPHRDPSPAQQERRAQLRGLLLLALAALDFLLWRSAPLHLFHPGWWRL